MTTQSPEPVYRCVLCGAVVPEDDATVCTPGRTICARCWNRETGNQQAMPAGLRRDLEAVVATIPAIDQMDR